ncbi:MAG TPA: S8 family serine peptidase, partial [Pyrinomonadaceae bacterium]|nr:S8 family serine peptidase [Pyrinomonadaceae bacterium]
GATNINDVLAGFSSRGSWVMVAAPGEAILSTVPISQYATWSGTSMAAPIVAGEAALLRANFPLLLNKDLARHLTRMTVNIGGDVQSRIDAGAALTTTPDNYASPTPTPTPPTPTPSPTPKGSKNGNARRNRI